MKKLTTILMATLSASLLCTTASAMSVKLTLDKSINHQFSFKYDIYNSKGPLNGTHNSMSLDGIDVTNLDPFMNSMNSILGSLTPGNSRDGKPSTISVSYTGKDGITIRPASCSNIIAKPVMNILMTESGCTIS